MKKIFILSSTLLFCLFSLGQKKTKEERQLEIDSRKKTKTIQDTLKTKCGYKISKNDYIKIGIGSMPDGDFKYIRRKYGSLTSYKSLKGYQGLENQANALPRSESGLKYKVKDIEHRGDEKRGFINYLKIGAGIVNYEIDIENAILSGEIDVPDEFKPKLNNSEKQNFSISDELIKLKKLYDEGVLTKEEFETQKKKLLEN